VKVFFVYGGERGFEYHLPCGGAQPKRKTRLRKDAFPLWRGGRASVRLFPRNHPTTWYQHQ
jgi:hypothetical protein